MWVCIGTGYRMNTLSTGSLVNLELTTLAEGRATAFCCSRALSALDCTDCPRIVRCWRRATRASSSFRSPRADRTLKPDRTLTELTERSFRQPLSFIIMK